MDCSQFSFQETKINVNKDVYSQLIIVFGGQLQALLRPEGLIRKHALKPVLKVVFSGYLN